MKSKVNFYNKTEEKLPINKKFLEKLIICLLSLIKKKKSVSFSVLLVNDQVIQELNYTYRHKKKVTDVLSFSSNFTEKFLASDLGDIFVDYYQAERQAKEYGHSVKKELIFLISHGILHLLGYDHQTKKEEIIMNDWCFQIMKKLG